MPIKLFGKHIQDLQKSYEGILEKLADDGTSIDAVFIHSGVESSYYQDDNHKPFKAYSHFLQWVPVNRSDQAILVRPGMKPVYYQVIPRDFWYDQSVIVESWWADFFDIVTLENSQEIYDHLPELRSIAFIGQDTAFAGRMGFPASLTNAESMLHALAWRRAYKTEYEVECLRQANKMAVSAHAAAQACFFEGGSELDVHLAFLRDAGIMEHESPYMNIVAFDKKSAILHYQYKGTQSGSDSQVMLIDGGVPFNFYGSDLTRTYAREQAHPTFKRLIEGVDKIQLDLVNYVIPGDSYQRIHEKAHEMILDLLIAEDIVRGEKKDLISEMVSHLFLPHGIGHLLGLQVHDLAGHYKDETGALNPPPEDYAFLRLTRTMEPGMVFTIEPGLYFIPVLLEPERKTTRGSFLNWKLIDELTPFGGVRIEDNILVTENGAENLTR